MRDQPLDLVIGLAKGLNDFCGGMWGYWKSLTAVTPVKLLNRCLAIFILVMATRFAWITRRDTTTSLLLAANAGLLLSGPIIWPDGRERVLAVSMPLFCLLLTVGVGRQRQRHDFKSAQSERAAAGGAFPSFALSAAIVVLALIGPALAHWQEPTRLIQRHVSPSESTIIVHVGPATPRIQILESDSQQSPFAPLVRMSDFERDVASKAKYIDQSLAEHVNGSKMLMLAYNYRSDLAGMRYVVGPPAMITDQWRWLEISGVVRQFKQLRCLVVSDYKLLPAERTALPRVAIAKDSQ